MERPERQDPLDPGRGAHGVRPGLPGCVVGEPDGRPGRLRPDRRGAAGPHHGRGAYARLAPEDEFILGRIDGCRTIRDLVLDYLAEYRAFAYERVVGLVEQLRAAGRAALYREIPFSQADCLAALAYRAGGRWVFAPVVALLLALVALVGLPLFIEQTLSRPDGFPRIGDSGPLTLAVWLGLFLLVVAIHEGAHALAVTHYGREVRRAGFALYLLAPAFFVDTTDIWLAPRRARVVSAFAGVFSGFVLGGVASIARLLVEPSTVADVIAWYASLMCCSRTPHRGGPAVSSCRRWSRLARMSRTASSASVRTPSTLMCGRSRSAPRSSSRRSSAARWSAVSLSMSTPLWHAVSVPRRPGKFRTSGRASAHSGHLWVR